MRLRLTPAFFVGFLVLVLPIEAQSTPSVKGEVLEFGIMKAVADTKIAENPDAPTGTRTTSKAVEITEHTEKIPAMRGVGFGIQYKITGIAEQDSVALQKTVKHPPFKNNKGEMESQYSVTIRPKVKDGTVVSFEGYKLGRPEELVPGVWTFEISYHEQKLISQSFTVVSPAERIPK